MGGGVLRCSFFFFSLFVCVSESLFVWKWFLIFVLC